ncbi:P-loop containing nucleoside triphosphate hydrolase protein [Mycena galericulata]|nr:P-loop containing nucleoside triphosphate hydrolase protein [Mycena galericulata]
MPGIPEVQDDQGDMTLVEMPSSEPDREMPSPVPDLSSPVRRDLSSPAQAPQANATQMPSSIDLSSPVRPSPVQSGSKNKDLLASLRKLYGSTADWTSHGQYEALKEVAALERDVLVNLPTGSGKTVVAVLSSRVENGYTVIVLPLISLMEDWERRLDKLGIPYERFEGAKNPHLHGRHNIILVTSDMAKHVAWGIAIRKLNTVKPVLRYVFDEVQFYFTDFDFRKGALNHPFTIRKFACQTVLMSATIPENAERYLTDMFVLSRPKRISAIGDREELKLRIFRKSDLLAATESLVRGNVESGFWREQDRFLVFVTSHDDGQTVAKKLGLHFYHAHSTKHPIAEEVRQEMYENWLKGTDKGLVATNALGAGTDYPHVRFTLHFEAPHDLIVCEQQRGRAGRDGELAYNYLVVSKIARPINPGSIHETYGDMRGVQVLHNLLYKKTHAYPESCHVYQVTAFLDGKGFTCAALKRRYLCQSCKEGADTRPKETLIVRRAVLPANKSLVWSGERTVTGMKRKLAAFEESAATAVQRTGKLHDDRSNTLKVFTDLIEHAGTLCGYCIAVRVPDPKTHDPEDCPTISSQEKILFKDFRHSIKYRRQGTWSGPCWKCHIASMGQDSLHPRFTVGLKCDHPSLVLPLAFAIYQIPKLRQRALAFFKPQEIGHTWNSLQDFGKWFAIPHPSLHSQSMAILKWYSEYHFQ